MINNWKKQLNAIGFEKIGRRSFRRPSVPVAACIYETPLRVGSREVRIDLSVEVQDPWATDRTRYAADLNGNLTPEGIYLYYDPTPRWLRQDEAGSVHAILEACLESWFNYWSNCRHLIQYLEDPMDIILTRRSPSTGKCEHIMGVPAKRRSSPNTNYLLSLLYYHIGNFQEALSAANRYLQFVGPLTAYEGEPDRTRRQIAELSAKIESQTI